MGKLTVKGFPVETTKAITEKWRLKAGDIFDDGYAREFSSKQMGEALRGIFAERRAQGKSAPDVKWIRNLDRETLTVDIILELTN